MRERGFSIFMSEINEEVALERSHDLRALAQASPPSVPGGREDKDLTSRSKINQNVACGGEKTQENCQTDA